MKKKFLTISLTFAFICIALICFYTLTVSAAIHTTLYVGGTEVTEQNASDVFGDGTVSFDSTTNTLTLNNATIDEYFTEEYFGDDAYFGIYCEANKINLVLIGENAIYLSDDGDTYFGIYSSGTMNISGTGSLYIKSFGGIAAMGGITVKNCSIESTGIAISSMGEASLDNVTLETKYTAIGALDDVTVTNSTIVAGENIVMMDGAGSFLVEDSIITVVNGQYSSPINVPNGNVTIKNSTLDFNVNAIEEESAMGIMAGNQLTLENVQANIELRTKAGYALMGMAKVTIKKSNLILSTVSLEGRRARERWEPARSLRSRLLYPRQSLR